MCKKKIKTIYHLKWREQIIDLKCIPLIILKQVYVKPVMLNVR
jgi:hypothetical protein